MNERRIYNGSENRLRMWQKYTHKFHCSFYLRDYPFDTQVQQTLSLQRIVFNECISELLHIDESGKT